MTPEESQSDEVLPSPPPFDARTAPTQGDSPAEPLTEDQALSVLNNRDLPAIDLENIAKNSALMKSRKLRLAVAAHPCTARRIALRLIRELYTFELMQFSLMPAAPADLKRSAGDLLVARIASVTLGERISLARRSSAQVAAALLLDKAIRVWQTALENPRLTEAAVVNALRSPKAAPLFVESVCGHAKWPLRPEIRIALLRNPHTPLARALEFARRLPPPQLRDILHSSRLPEKIKAYLRKELKARPK